MVLQSFTLCPINTTPSSSHKIFPSGMHIRCYPTNLFSIISSTSYFILKEDKTDDEEEDEAKDDKELEYEHMLSDTF